MTISAKALTPGLCGAIGDALRRYGEVTTDSLWANPPKWCAEQGATLSPFQQEIMEAVYEHPRVCVVAGNEVGKGHALAWLTYHWLQQDDGRVLTSANTNDQVRENTWYEMRKCHRRYQWPGDILTQRWRYNAAREAFGVTSDVDDVFQGKHEGKLLVAFDESSGKRLDLLWEDMRTLVGEDGRILLQGNPKRRTGVFAKAMEGQYGFHVIRISGVDVADWQREVGFTLPGLVTWSKLREWAEHDCGFPAGQSLDELRNWATSNTWAHPESGLDLVGGRRNDWWRVHVLGLKPRGSLSLLFTPDALDTAMARLAEPMGDWVLGVDVARAGGDRTVVFGRRGHHTEILFNLATTTHTATYAKLKAWLEQVKAQKVLYPKLAPAVRSVNIDSTGEGSGLADFMQRDGWPVRRIHFNGKPLDQEKYGNLRAELFFRLKDWLDVGGCLPDMDELTEELEAMEPYYRERGKDGAEQRMLPLKSQLKATLGRSPDLADALALTMVTDTAKPGGLVIHKSALGRSMGV